MRVDLDMRIRTQNCVLKKVKEILQASFKELISRRRTNREVTIKHLGGVSDNKKLDKDVNTRNNLVLLNFFNRTKKWLPRQTF